MNFEYENRLALRSNGQEVSVEHGALSFAHVKAREKSASLWGSAMAASHEASAKSPKGLNP